MYNSAITQGELELYKAQIDDANKRNTLLQGYHTMCPEPQVKNEKRKTFYIAKYREVDTVLHDTYRDEFGRDDVINYVPGVARQIMNGGLDALAASTEWRSMCNEPNAVVDEFGRNEKYKKQVSVRKKTINITRNGVERRKEAVAAEP